jgi:hypothetical protein
MAFRLAHQEAQRDTMIMMYSQELGSEASITPRRHYHSMLISFDDHPPDVSPYELPAHSSPWMSGQVPGERIHNHQVCRATLTATIYINCPVWRLECSLNSRCRFYPVRTNIYASIKCPDQVTILIYGSKTNWNCAVAYYLRSLRETRSVPEAPPRPISTWSLFGTLASAALQVISVSKMHHSIK